MTDPSLWSILPNLGVGVASIAVVGYAFKYFIDHLKYVSDQHGAKIVQIEQRAERRIQEIENSSADRIDKIEQAASTRIEQREVQIRELEKEIRTTVIRQLQKSTQVISKANNQLKRRP